MQIPLKTAFLFIALLSSSLSYSQSKQDVFAAIQKLAGRATGEKVQSNNVFAKEKDKITRQVFSEGAVSVTTKNLSKNSNEWVHRYTEIPWNNLFDYNIYTEYVNSDLQIVMVNFKGTMQREYFQSEKSGADNPSTSSSFEFYVLTKDKAEVEKYLNLLYSFKEKKAESALNAQIRKFTKEETISWLTTKLKQYIRAGQYGTQIRIVSLDACNLVITYRSLVRSYEEVLPTSIKAINKYGKFEYTGAKASIRTTTPDSFDKGEKRYGFYSSDVSISTSDEEVMENIECALKHLSGFCGAAGFSGTASPSGTVVKESSSMSTQTTAATGSQWYMYFTKGKAFGAQACVHREEFPGKDIEERWKQNFYITDISYGGPKYKWFVTFSKPPGYTDQLWRKRESRAETIKAIDDIWKNKPGFAISNLAFINHSWIVVVTKGTASTKQVYFSTDEFPEEQIKKYWKENYDITSMVYSPEGWLIVMSQGHNYIQRYRKFETTAGWNHQQILDDEKAGYYISLVVKTNDTWYVVLQKETKVTAAEYNLMENLSTSTIKEQWSKGLDVDKVLYIPAKYE